jgi:hypothetical protein
MTTPYAKATSDMRAREPISRRLRNAEVTARARKLLQRLDADIGAQRRVKHLAAKALAAIFEMDAAADIKLRSMSTSDRDRWSADCRSLQSTLTRFVRRGVS